METEFFDLLAVYLTMVKIKGKIKKLYCKIKTVLQKIYRRTDEKKKMQKYKFKRDKN